ncbi:hypothetical protein ACFOLF_00060 [Paenibacillus sepulcri]|uniref:Uncharacterized protein n=1 Tax=Paenibacillus sepulcri TaxID=359917 RepID=A0ABS7C0X3_9BACL|nr:hypothetical protein [Paenibacillus sepulcri]
MHSTAQHQISTRSLRLSHWPQWIGYAAAVWSLLYGLLGVFWTLGGEGFPFGHGHDPNPEYSALGFVHAETAAPVIAAMGLLGAVVSLMMTLARRRHAGSLRLTLSAFAWLLAILLLLVVPDYRTLASVAYVFLLKFSIINWSILNQFLCIIGGFLWVLTTIAYQRRVHFACENCGRTEKGVAGWTEPAAAARWGRWVTLIAVFIPMVYSITRIAWAFDIPLLVSSEFLHSMNGEFPGIWWFGAALGLIEIGGSVLTYGLIRHWGEVFPCWTLGLSGKKVPPALAIIPASIMSVLTLEAGLMMWRGFLLGAFAPGNIGTFAPSLLWPLWGLALGAATLAYYYRRRGRCKHCGQGE